MAELHPLVAGFSDAEVYERGRVGYSEQAAAAIAELIGLRPGATVLDLGAGTGKLSRALLAAGYDVIAVEPLEQMRAILIDVIGAERVRTGTAEAIPLDADTVDGITCADSFHWFDERQALTEMRRVLRPAGGVAILRAEPQVEAPWTEEVGKLVLAYRREHPAFDGRPAAAALEEDPAFGAVSERMIVGRVDYDREGILAGVASMSFIGGLPADERRDALGRVEAVLKRARVTNASYAVHYQMWGARLRPQ
ncbi:MAG TPA: class I SAM-dependent methyltransferase [Solirubrobacteraceae bacterium]